VVNVIILALMKEHPNYQLETPETVAMQLAHRCKQLRLLRRWKQSSLAARAGVSLASLRRFEQTGRISLQHLLGITFALGRLSDFEVLFQQPAADSIATLEAMSQPGKQRRRGNQ